MKVTSEECSHGSLKSACRMALKERTNGAPQQPAFVMAAFPQISISQPIKHTLKTMHIR